MCRNIRLLFNFDPPATDDEIRAASVQFVRKLSGFDKPSHASEAAFGRAVDDIAGVARELVDSLVTTATPRDREEWSAKAKARAAERFARSGGLPRTLDPAEPPFRPRASHGPLAAQPPQQQLSPAAAAP